MPKVNKTVTIKRSEWRRAGFGSYATQLYNPAEPTGFNKCCLGQYLEQCGVSLENLERRETPDQVPVDWTPEIELLVDPGDGNPDTTWIADLAMGINDNLDFTNEQREAELAMLFVNAGVTLVFVD
jgi:hypothetical protein